MPTMNSYKDQFIKTATVIVHIEKKQNRIFQSSQSVLEFLKLTPEEAILICII